MQYFVCNYGLGDIFNQIIYLESNMTSRFNLIVPKRNLEVAKFLYKNIITEDVKFSGEILQYDFPTHVFPNLSTIGLEGYNLKMHSPKIEPLANVLDEKNVVIAHGALCGAEWEPFQSQKIIKKIKNYFSKNEGGNKKAIFFTERSDNFSIEKNLWDTISQTLVQKGYNTFTNLTDKQDVYKNEFLVEGSSVLKMSLIDIIQHVKENSNTILIGQRAGIFDVLKYTQNLKIIVYPEQPDWLYPGCNFAKGKEAVNVFEIGPPYNYQNVLDKINYLDL